LSGDPARPAASGEIRLVRARFKRHPIGDVLLPFQYDGGTLTVKRGSLHQGKGSYRVSGKVDRLIGPFPPQMNLSISARNVDPQQVIVFFLPNFPLVTHATGAINLNGPWNAPRVSAQLGVKKGTLYGEPFDEGRIALRLNKRSIRFTEIELIKSDRWGKSNVIGSGEIEFRKGFKADIRSEGVWMQQIRSITQSLPQLTGKISGNIKGEGLFDRPMASFAFAVSETHYENAAIGDGKITGTLENGLLSLRAVFPKTGVEAQGNMKLDRIYPYHVAATLKKANIDPYLRPIDPDLVKKMSLSASGKIEADGKLTQLRASRVRISLIELSADVAGYPISNEGNIELELSDETLRLIGFHLKGEETSLNVSGEVRLFKEYDLFLNGEAGLRLLGLLTRGVTYGQGKAYLVLKISNRWDDPRMRGGLTLHNGVIHSNLLSAPLDVTELSIFFNEKQLLLESFEADMGKGHLSGSGKIDVKRFAATRFGFLLDMKDLRANLMDGLSSSISGTLLYQGTPQSQEIKGDVQILRALYDKRLELKSFLVRFTKAESVSSAPSIPAYDLPWGGSTRLNVHFFGQDNIWIQNNVAKIPMNIDLFLRGTLEQPLLFGRVEIPRGTVHFRQNDFNLQLSSVEFLNQERIDPHFDLKANTKIRNYSIDLALIGTLEHFTLSLTSIPSLTQPDILALLTTGQTTEEINQGGKVRNEAVSFVVSEFLEEPVQSLTGIERFQVESYADSGTTGATGTAGATGSAGSTPDSTKGTAGTQITVGKRLMEDRLVVTYKTMLQSSQEQLLQMEYEINKNVSLIGTRDEKGQIAGDIRFRFEFH
ncbi:MAG TPA: translocation/assembly module TamB domain-containing protein, partial [Nitrospiria bacterium]|nr:translocation/assembly module TamB domain-containing protein [Nitrospiria bacterium]